LERFARAITGANRLEQLGVGPDLRVAIHARFRRWNARKTRGLDRSVAVTAVDAESGHVMLMAEWNGLRLAYARIGNERGTLNDVHNPARNDNEKHCTENGGTGQRIRAAMKDLRHSLLRYGPKRPGGASLAC